jgi:hypothetical protein
LTMRQLVDVGRNHLLTSSFLEWHDLLLARSPARGARMRLDSATALLERCCLLPAKLGHAVLLSFPTFERPDLPKQS